MSDPDKSYVPGELPRALADQLTHIRPSGFDLAPVVPPDDSPRPGDQFMRADGVLRPVVSRTGSICIGCGLYDMGAGAAPTGMFDIIPADLDYRPVIDAANKETMGQVTSQLWPVCPICFDVLHLGHAPDHDRGEVLLGTLIDQVTLTNLCRTLMVAVYQEDQYAVAARGLWSAIRDALWRSTHEIMPDSYDGQVSTFGSFMRSQDFRRAYHAGDVSLSRVRYMPALDAYPAAIVHWHNTQYAGLPESDWAQYAAL